MNAGTNDALDPLALSLRGSHLIEASAGTGKTWTIAALYLRLVLGHGDDDSAFATPLPPSRILVMTFTIAATRELLERIRERLVDAARRFRADPAGDDGTDDDPFVARLMASYPPGPARAQAAWRLATAAEAMDDAAVVTIDAWVQRMLREHAFDSGSVFDEVLEPDQEAMLYEAARDYWRQEIYPLTGATFAAAEAVWPTVEALRQDALRLMTKVDDAVDERPLGIVVEQADATQRHVLAAWKHGWPERLQAMRAWLKTQMGLKTRGPFKPNKPGAKHVDDWLAKLDAWAADPDRIDLGISKDARSRLSPTGLRECATDPTSLEIPPVFQAFAELVRPRGLVGPSAAMRVHAARRIRQRVRRLKHDAGIFGFQDQLERLDRALAGPAGERLRARIIEQHPVALIDEFQDTSPLQYRIFDRLYRVAANDRATALLLIGDPKQSIYAFREADILGYLRARTATEGRHARLTTNYRSTTGLVAAVNRLFGAADDVADGAFRFGRAPDGPLPFVPVDARGRDAVLVTGGGPAPSLTIVHDATIRPMDEVRQRFADQCAEHIATLLGDPRAGFATANGAFRQLGPADVAVLVRTGTEAAAVRRALQRRGVASAYLSDQESVFASEEAADLLPWLRAVAEPLDGRRARIAFATGLIGLSLDEMAALADDERCFEMRIEQLRMLHVEWREQGVLAMLRRTLHLLDLPARWLADGDGDGERRLTNVLHLAELLQAASAKLDGEEAVIRWFGERLAAPRKRSDEEVVRLESDAALLRVVTVHGAKGLEYPVVCLPFATSVRDAKPGDVAWLPDADGERRLIFDIDTETRARVDLEAKQEDLRLLYVAVTRAQHALWIGVAPPKNDKTGSFHRSALGYLLTADQPIDVAEIPRVIEARFGDLRDFDGSVRIAPATDEPPVTRLAPARAPVPLLYAPVYAASFERDWSIGSFSSLVRGLPRLPAAVANVDPAMEEELREEPDDDVAPVVPSALARHRFPRGAFAGNFLHGQLEWLAAERFALRDAAVATELAARCERQGWGPRADDVVTWLGEVVTNVLPAVGVALDGLTTILPEMEFWFPSGRLDTRRIDALCHAHLLPGRHRSPLPARTLRGMLMGYVDLVFEHAGRYWLLDYKSNALGDDDRAYTTDALETAMTAHRYDVQGAIYLLALHRLLRRRLGDRYDPRRQLGGAVYLFMRGVHAATRGCCVLAPDVRFLDALDAAVHGASDDDRQALA